MSSDRPHLPQSIFSDPTQQRWDGVDLSELLSLTYLDESVSRSRFCEDNRNGRVFGGQLLGQALLAARGSVDHLRMPTALRVLFMQGALSDRPIDYQAEVLQEGKRFSSRRVAARQEGRFLVDAHATFQLPENGYEHVLPAFEAVPGPEQLLSMSELSAAGTLTVDGIAIDWSSFEKSCLELKVVAPEEHLNHCSAAPRMSFWVRLRRRLNDDPAMHAAALAYLSDYWINSAAVTRHVPAGLAHGRLYIASLNHSLWFHRFGRADEWLLFSSESPSAQGGRALTNARIYSRDGALLASLTQECLMARR